MRASSRTFRASSWSALRTRTNGQRDFVSQALRVSRRSAMLKRCLPNGVDAVTIAAPTHLHRELALTCIERGVHVLVEKPIAPSVRGGTRDHRGGAARPRRADGRPRRAVQSDRRGDQGRDPRRGHSVDRHHARRPVPAAHVERRRGHRSRRARHRPDPLVHRVRHHRGAAAALQRGRRARGHRAPAVPHRLGRARPHQHQLAHAVQGAQRAPSRRATNTSSATC